MRRGFVAVEAVILCAAVAFAQQPSPSVSPLPAIAPAQAHLAQTLGGLEAPGTAIAYSQQTGVLAAGCESGRIHWWDKSVTLGVRAGVRSPNFLALHKSPITALTCGQGSLFASADASDRKVLLWTAPEGTLVHSLPVETTVRALSITPDGKLLACAGEEGGIQLWDAAAGRLRSKLDGSAEWTLCLAFSPDGKQLASGGYDRAVRLWDIASGKKLLELPTQPPPPPNQTQTSNTVTALAFSPDGKDLALGGSDAQIHLVHLADGKIVRSLPGHDGSITGLAFHAGGTLLASASKDRTVRLWNPTNGQPLKTLEGHTAWVEGIVFLAQSTRLASVGADQEVRIWELR
jgi:WD40 repeat protein